MGGQGLPSFVNVCSIPCSETGLSRGERLEGAHEQSRSKQRSSLETCDRIG